MMSKCAQNISDGVRGRGYETKETPERNIANFSLYS